MQELALRSQQGSTEAGRQPPGSQQGRQPQPHPLPYCFALAVGATRWTSNTVQDAARQGTAGGQAAGLRVFGAGWGAPAELLVGWVPQGGAGNRLAGQGEEACRRAVKACSETQGGCLYTSLHGTCSRLAPPSCTNSTPSLALSTALELGTQLPPT